MRTILTTLHSKFIHPSLALPCLVAYCDKEPGACGELFIREFTVHEPRENILAALLAEQPDVVAFSVYIWNRGETLALVDALHVTVPHLRIILGGPEVSYEQHNLWPHHPGISAIIRGEGEQPLQELLHCWQHREPAAQIPRTTLRTADGLDVGPDAPPMELDQLPSPFRLGVMDCTRGFVYYETSRGCPYRCAFCMSALDPRVRSFSLERIETDLLWLMEREIPKIKLVDRTFNYDRDRARHLFRFILQHNRCSHFHFEIGAHLLDAKTLQLLEQVPEDSFQFEIGVQSVLPETLDLIERSAPLELLEANVRHLLQRTRIHLHLDLIAGLPGEDFAQVLSGIDRVMALRPHHLQIEPLKLLPGAPLRQRAQQLGLRFDPAPPYTILSTPDLAFNDLERLRSISRLLDMTWNSGRAHTLLTALAQKCGGFAAALNELEKFWREEGLFRFPLAQKEMFEQLVRFVGQAFAGEIGACLGDLAARDFALSERLTPSNLPACFHSELDSAQQQRVQDFIKDKLEQIRGQGIKLQYLAVRFPALDAEVAQQVRVFCYLTGSGRRMQVEEYCL
ncbi:MAG: DUF4080 domain-containing protein [Desulfuromonadaceae bacterium]|nr:DUF4080 domain-containing protein [Desulfuromonadaceae bacterium]